MPRKANFDEPKVKVISICEQIKQVYNKPHVECCSMCHDQIPSGTELAGCEQPQGIPVIPGYKFVVCCEVRNSVLNLGKKVLSEDKLTHISYLGIDLEKVEEWK